MQGVAVCCSVTVLQCVAVCCSALKCDPGCCSVLQCVGSVLKCVFDLHMTRYHTALESLDALRCIAVYYMCCSVFLIAHDSIARGSEDSWCDAVCCSVFAVCRSAFPVFFWLHMTRWLEALKTHGVLRCVAVCLQCVGSVSQCVCSVLQCVFDCAWLDSSRLWRLILCCGVLQCVAVRLQCVVVYLQCVFDCTWLDSLGLRLWRLLMCCGVFQCVAVYCWWQRVNSPRTQASPRRCVTSEIDQQDWIACILKVGVHALYEVTVLQCVAVCCSVL